MKLSEYTIDNLKKYISGDNGLTPYLSGPNIIELFNQVGCKDIYKIKNGGLPGGVSRNEYVVNKLTDINGTKNMLDLLELVFNQKHFAGDTEKDICTAVDSVNKLLQDEGLKLELMDGHYKVIGADIPEDIEVEIHFEDIQRQVKEQINLAKYTIWIAVAWFTDRTLYDLLIDKKKEGVNIQIVVIDDDTNKKYGFRYEDHFETYRVKPKGKYENIMHHKFCVIDLKTVIHGSYNWTNKAKWNKETISIDVSRELAEKFSNEFLELKKQ